MTALPASLITRPIAHRGLHDAGRKIVENAPAAVRAAVRAGYGIELDLQLSADGEAVVFHDYALGRLTPETGPVRQMTAAALGALPLGSGQETIPMLPQILREIRGRVPLLLEIKDQDGALGPQTGELEAAVARALQGYRGEVAVMSFNPHVLQHMRRLAPTVARGLVTDSFEGGNWGLVPLRTRERLRGIPDYAAVGASFISHRASDLDNPHVARLKAGGARILCWTVRSAAQEKDARRVADNITFEGYLPRLPEA